MPEELAKLQPSKKKIELLEFEMISADTSFSGFSSYSSFSGSQNEMLMLASTLTFEEREKPE